MAKSLIVDVAAGLMFLSTVLAQAQSGAPRNAVEQEINPAIARYIDSVAAIDNHAHVVLPPPDDATDHDFDALPVDNMEPQTDPVAWRADNPQLPAAWKALWNLTGTVPLNADGMKQLQAARVRVKAQHATSYDIWVLDQAHVGTIVANRVAMTAAIPPPRFRWVPYNDTLLFPLDNTALAAETPDRALFFPLEAKVMARYLQAAHLQTLPTTLDAYMSTLVLPILQSQQKSGAVAIKFEVAYLRDFGFNNPPHEDAARVYAKYIHAKSPDAAEYKLLQDYLFRAIAIEAGKLGMAVHLHTMSGGGGYFSIAGDNPLLLEPLFNDPHLRGTNFVMLHGGWPFVHEVGSLLQKPNAFLDLSQEAITFSPRTLAVWLREWLETFPDKVLYGTDAYPYNEAMGWEESLWIANRNAREALGLALSGMLRDGEIDEARAEHLAHDVLRGNAVRLYHLP